MARYSRKANALPPRERGENPVFSNMTYLLAVNFEFIAFLLPPMALLAVFQVTGGMVFFVGALALSIPAGPSLAAMFDVGYQLVRRIPAQDRRSFFKSWRGNWKQASASMLLLQPPMAVLLLLSFTVDRPAWVTLCLLLGTLALAAFAVLTFSQIALVPLKLGQLWKNSLLLLPLMGWRLLVALLIFLGAAAILYEWLAYAFVGFLFWIPAILVTAGCGLLWPKLAGYVLKTP